MPAFAKASESFFASNDWNVCIGRPVAASLWEARRATCGRVAHRATVTKLRTFAKDRQDFLSGFRAGKTFAYRAVIQKFCYGSQRAQVRLKLIFRHDKKNNEFYGGVIQRVELDPFSGPSERSHHFVEPIG